MIMVAYQVELWLCELADRMITAKNYTTLYGEW
jgi:hypothetical protein